MPRVVTNFKDVLDGMLHIINDPILGHMGFHSVKYKLQENKSDELGRCSFTLTYILDGKESEYVIHDMWEFNEHFSYEFCRNLFFQKVVMHLMLFKKNDNKQTFYEQDNTIDTTP